MQKHDESKDVYLVKRKANVDTRMKVIEVDKSTQVGIRTWSRIDYLVNYCGYKFFSRRSADLAQYKQNSNDVTINDNSKVKKDIRRFKKHETYK